MGFEVLDIGPFPETRCKISTGTITDVMAIKNLLNEAAYTIVDARYIIDRAQVASAVATACVAQREGRLLTRSLATEILYRISGSTNV